jgi:hypothetical protein
MEILNTSGGGLDTLSIVIGVIFAITAVGLALLAVMSVISRELTVGALIWALFLCGANAYLSYNVLTEKSPVRHEVLLRDGAVIDANTYKVVEQRGKIYVVEERRKSK